ncbi:MULTISPECIES: ABC transporter permease [Metabacillus]|jgi:putative ABC transport system permease protein|uniref:ABC transporter permease n=1 Tax=Metabacillus rhizolycopersici TaxID=2875709 RepID=A0ABS7UKF9_9BACI|nr:MULTISPECIES: ABC transporter permease [Metabacillus]MBZ5748793.1 ABC transporter permease [Metabacillus rhizolycopersici]MCM3652831.1 ABC transporter permease [Metabacillus litoralis]
MSLLENMKMALSSVLAHKLRSILTMLGIIIGVASVILVVAIGQGGEQLLKSAITGPGNTIEVYYEPSEEEMMSNPNAFMNAAFTQDDVNALKDIPEVNKVVASSTEYFTTRFREETADTSVYGVNEAYIEVNNLQVQSGRNLVEADFIGGARIGVISDNLKTEMFDGDNPIGEVIWVKGQPIEIVGVLEKPTGLFAFGAMEVYIPWNTFRASFGKNDYNQITLQAINSDVMQEAGDKATSMLNATHNTEDSYKVFNMEEMAAGVGQVTTIMTLIIGSIAGISLIVGGIGVMNIMLVSVTERTREIGIRKALGATKRQILTQFLIESVTLTLIGGIVGIIFGAIAANIVSVFAGWPPLISWQVVVGGLLFSMLIGIVFGMLPANKAARLSPIESLRYE